MPYNQIKFRSVINIIVSTYKTIVEFFVRNFLRSNILGFFNIEFSSHELTNRLRQL